MKIWAKVLIILPLAFLVLGCGKDKKNPTEPNPGMVGITRDTSSPWIGKTLADVQDAGAVWVCTTNWGQVYDMPDGSRLLFQVYDPWKDLPNTENLAPYITIGPIVRVYVCDWPFPKPPFQPIDPPPGHCYIDGTGCTPNNITAAHINR